MNKDYNLNTPIISIVASAHRDYRYKPCYDSLAENTKVPFEVIFVGDKNPLEKMPDNFKYLYTKVKPAQCYEIAVRNAQGKFVHHIGDDFTFDNGYLDKLYDYTLMLDMDKILICPQHRLMYNPPSFGMIEIGCHFSPDKADSHFIGISPLYRRDIWYKIGGIDRKFFGAYACMDVQMRFYELDFHPFIAPGIFSQENNFGSMEANHPSLIYRTGEEGRRVLNSFWIKPDGSMSKNRLYSVNSFDDKDILVKDQ